MPVTHKFRSSTKHSIFRVRLRIRGRRDMCFPASASPMVLAATSWAGSTPNGQKAAEESLKSPEWDLRLQDAMTTLRIQQFGELASSLGSEPLWPSDILRTHGFMRGSLEFYQVLARGSTAVTYFICYPRTLRRAKCSNDHGKPTPSHR